MGEDMLQINGLFYHNSYLLNQELTRLSHVDVEQVWFVRNF